jgi:ubiquinone/menaquinone biosynthesis C-methylase UbiE
MLWRFFEINRRLCEKIESRLPQAKTPVFLLYENIVACYMNARPNQIVLDIGGGESCPFAKYRDPRVHARIIAVDVSEEAMKNNHDVDEKRVADVTDDLPFGNGEVDLIASRTVLEHLQNPEAFIAISSRILKKDGHFINLFPSKFAPFALFNVMVPKKISTKLLSFFFPESRGRTGFPEFYKKCYYTAIKSLLEKHGLEIVFSFLSYYQSHYFRFFVPLFLVSALYEILLEAFGVKDLCAYVLVVARKK